MKRRQFLRQALLSAAGSALLPQIAIGNAFWEEQPPLMIDTKTPGRSFTHYWSKCVGGGRAVEGLKAGWLEQLQYVKQSCGFEYCRLQGLFNDEMNVYAAGNGFNWQQTDELLGRLLKIGIKPFVELDYFPKDIAGGSSTAYWWKANVTPPQDYSKWVSLVTNFAKHCVDKYGLDEVGTWYFEVWHEPNQRNSWDGTRAQYFEMYKVTAGALKGISARLKVGGPATSSFVPDERFSAEWEDKNRIAAGPVAEGPAWKGVWIDTFLAYCKTAQLPVDFVSTHAFPADGGQMRAPEATANDLQWLKVAVSKSAYPKAEIHVTEWASSGALIDHMRDNLPEAAFIIKTNIDAVGFADSLSYSSFIDGWVETGTGTAFCGGQGLVTSQGIAKPAFHAYRMLHTLGEELLYNKDGVIVTRHKSTQKITALLYHYPATMKTVPPLNGDAGGGEARQFSFNLTGVHGDARFNVEILNRQNGNALAAWKALGSPDVPDADQVKTLRNQALAVNEEQVIANGQGLLLFDKALQPWDVVLIDEV